MAFTRWRPAAGHGAPASIRGDAGAADETRRSAEQRELLIDAFTRTVAERGYAGTTVNEVARRAGLSREVFHAHFADLRRCFAAAHDAFFERLAREVDAAVEPEADWPEQLRAAVAAGIEFLVETASRARVFAVEAPAIGPLFLERHLASVESAAELLRGGRDRFPRAASLPACTEAVLIGGIVLRARAYLLAEEAPRLPELEAEFVAVLLTPYLGAEEAERIAGPEGRASLSPS